MTDRTLREGIHPSRAIVTMLAAILFGGAGVADAADCIDVRDPAALVFEGRLVDAVLPGPPGWADVPNGDMAETLHLLELKRPICGRGDELLEGDVPVDRVQLFSSDGSMEKALTKHAGRNVSVVAENAFGAHTRHHRAPLVASVVQIRAAAGTTSPVGDGGDGAEATVRAFYAAVGRADGPTASALVVPEKRARAPYAADEITRFYGGLAVPLAVASVERRDDGVLVRYGYTAAGGRRCDGRAMVRLTLRDGRPLIEAIRALDGC